MYLHLTHVFLFVKSYYDNIFADDGIFAENCSRFPRFPMFLHCIALLMYYLAINSIDLEPHCWWIAWCLQCNNISHFLWDQKHTFWSLVISRCKRTSKWSFWNEHLTVFEGWHWNWNVTEQLKIINNQYNGFGFQKSNFKTIQCDYLQI